MGFFSMSLSRSSPKSGYGYNRRPSSQTRIFEAGAATTAGDFSGHATSVRLDQLENGGGGTAWQVRGRACEILDWAGHVVLNVLGAGQG